MNDPLDPYIQYLTLCGNVKVTTTSRWVNNDTNTIQYVVSNINEPFFLLNLFDQNKKVDGIIFDNVDNLDMLAFLNSDLQSVDAVPEKSFFNAFQTVAMLRSSVPLDVNNLPIAQQNLLDYYDTELIKYLKSYLFNKFNTLSGITIKPYIIQNLNDSYSAYLAKPHKILFGNLVGNGLTISSVFDSSGRFYNNTTDGKIPVFLSSINIPDKTLSNGYTFCGYEIETLLF